MPGPTYHLYSADGAARNAVIVQHPDELGGMYFASLTIQLHRAGVQSVAPRIRKVLTPDVGSIEVFEDTHSLIVADFSDRLFAAWEIAISADTPPTRDDDLVVADHVVRIGSAERAIAAVERLRERDETWKATINEPANLVLISGRRDQVEIVLQRLKQLDVHDESVAFKESTQTIKLIYLTPAEAVATLRQMFEAKLAGGAVQIGGFDRDRKVVFRGSEYDFTRAKAAIKAIDAKPENEKK
jgi:type II secretory pathway component GspD/PulD (secretin)